MSRQTPPSAILPTKWWETVIIIHSIIQCRKKEVDRNYYRICIRFGFRLNDRALTRAKDAGIIKDDDDTETAAAVEKAKLVNSDYSLNSKSQQQQNANLNVDRVEDSKSGIAASSKNRFSHVRHSKSAPAAHGVDYGALGFETPASPSPSDPGLAHHHAKKLLELKQVLEKQARNVTNTLEAVARNLTIHGTGRIGSSREDKILSTAEILKKHEDLASREEKKRKLSREAGKWSQGIDTKELIRRSPEKSRENVGSLPEEIPNRSRDENLSSDSDSSSESSSEESESTEEEKEEEEENSSDDEVSSGSNESKKRRKRSIDFARGIPISKKIDIHLSLIHI